MKRGIRHHLLFLSLVLAIGGAAFAAAALAGRTTEAHNVPGEYSLEVNIAQANADIGEPFTVGVAIVHSMPNYQAVQWDIDYDETMIAIDIDATARDGAAPPNCGQKNDNGSRVLLGCIDIFGANLSYSGNAWNIVASCLGPNGPTTFALQNLSGVGAKTFVRIGAVSQPFHPHDDTIYCGPPPPTDTPTHTSTPQPPTSTPTRTPTATATPTRTHTPTATIDIPPDQNQFRQRGFDEPAASSELTGIDAAFELEIGTGWNPVDTESITVGGTDRLLVSLHRGDLLRRADLSGDDFVDLSDALIVVGAFGQPGTPSWKFLIFDPASQPTGAQFLADVDAQLESEIVDGFGVADSNRALLDGEERLVYGLQLRDTPVSTDVNGDGITDLTDALVVLDMFNEPVDPVTPSALPPGPSRFRHRTFDLAALPTPSAALLAELDFQLEGEIAMSWDPVDSTILNLDGDDQLVYSLQRSLRKNRGDLNSDNLIDLTDALIAIGQFGKPGLSAFHFATVDPTAYADEAALIADVDAQMEAKFVQGWKVVDSARMTLDGQDRLVYGLQLRTIPIHPDMNGDGLVDITDALIILSLFNTVP